MSEMADQIIEDGMNTPCDYCGTMWPQECPKNCERAHPPCVLRAESLASKWGFGDGDALDDYLYDLVDDGLIPDKPERDAFLYAVVMRYLVPELERLGIKVEIVKIGSNHNPVRADTVNGAEVDYVADEAPKCLRGVEVPIPRDELIEFARSFEPQPQTVPHKGDDMNWLEEWEEADRKRTQGEWGSLPGQGHDEDDGVDIVGAVGPDHRFLIGNEWDYEPDPKPMGLLPEEEAQAKAKADQEFIALNSVNVPKAIAEIRRLREALECIAAPLPKDYGWATKIARQALDPEGK